MVFYFFLIQSDKFTTHLFSVKYNFFYTTMNPPNPHHHKWRTYNNHKWWTNGIQQPHLYSSIFHLSMIVLLCQKWYMNPTWTNEQICNKISVLYTSSASTHDAYKYTRMHTYIMRVTHLVLITDITHHLIRIAIMKGGIFVKAIIYIVRAIYNFRSIWCNFLKQYYILVKRILNC